jgi:hypothetical protein
MLAGAGTRQGLRAFERAGCLEGSAMKTFGRILAAVAVAIATLFLGIFVYGRFSDGPVGFFSGGPFESGNLVAGEVDWRFATVWIVVEDGHAYIPCGLPNFTLWKQWPHEAVEDGRAMIRIDGKLYPVQLEKVEDPALISSLLQRVGGKYDLSPGENPDLDAVWFFHITKREAS